MWKNGGQSGPALFTFDTGRYVFKYNIRVYKSTPLFPSVNMDSTSFSSLTHPLLS